MITVRVRDRDVYAIPLWPITTGSVGLPVAFEFDEAWDGLTKIAVFRGSDTDVEVALLIDACVVPPEVLTVAGGDLYIGVYGRDAYGTTVIPTIWGKAGHIYDGTAPEDPDPTDPTPEWSYQVQQAAANALRIAQGVAAAAENGDFDGEDGVSPTVTITTITGGHRVTITDKDHPTGQSFDVMDGEDGEGGGGGTTDYDLLFVDRSYTYAQVETAYSAGKKVMFFENGELFPVLLHPTNQFIFIRSILNGGIRTVTITSSANWAFQTDANPGSFVKFTSMSLTDDKKEQARTNIGAGTYSKPSGGIPASDLASAVQESLNKADAALPKAGGTMSGAIAMGSNKITGLANGTADGDAVNLGQVSGLISTNTAFFRGSFASKAALLAVAWQTSDPSASYYVTNNDYAVVLDDESQSDECWRYVYVAGTGWQAQYRINETPLTPAQLAALNSGATAALIAQITANQTAIAGKIDKPSNPTSGQFLVYNGTTWAATTVPSANGVNF